MNKLIELGLVFVGVAAAILGAILFFRYLTRNNDIKQEEEDVEVENDSNV